MRLLTAIGLAAILVYAFALTWLSGMRGVFFIDHGIVFDGAWRILSGQRPFVDFFTPFGPVTYWLQAVFFWCFGVEFRSLVLFAALSNTLAAALVYSILQRSTPSIFIPLTGAAITASAFQAIFGVPFMENVAFLFELVALWLLWPAPARSAPRWALFLSGACWVVAFFAKQNAAGLLLPILLLALVGFEPRKSRVLFCFAGAAATAAAFAMWVWLATDPALFWRHFWELPAQVGRERLTAPDRLLKALLFSGYPTLPKFAEQFILFASLALAGLCFFNRSHPVLRTVLLPSLLSLGLIFYHALFELSSYQDPENCLPFLGLAFGWTLSGGFAFLRLQEMGTLSGTKLSALFTLPLAALSLLLIAKNSAFAWSRGAHQFPAGTSFTQTVDLPGLRGLQWGNPTPMGGEGPNLSAADFQKLLRFLQQNKEAFFVFPDSTILYGAAGQPSIGPLLFAYRNYLYRNSDIPRLDRQFLDSFRRHDVRWVILETEGSPARLPIWRDFPALKQHIEEEFESHSQIGPYRILQRKSRSLAPNASGA